VEAEVAFDAGAGLGHAGVGPQVDLVVFDGSPQALHEEVIASGVLAIHADLDLVGGQHLDVVGRCELAAPIAAEYLGLAVTWERLPESFDAEVTVQHGSQVEEAARGSLLGRQMHPFAERRDAGDVDRPDLVGPDDGQLPQQIEMNLVLGDGFEVFGRR